MTSIQCTGAGGASKIWFIKQSTCKSIVTRLEHIRLSMLLTANSVARSVAGVAGNRPWYVTSCDKPVNNPDGGCKFRGYAGIMARGRSDGEED